MINQIKLAILIDGAWFHKAIQHATTFKKRDITCEMIYENTKKIINDDEALYRIFYYNAIPYDKQNEINPISGERINFGNTSLANAMRKFHEDMNCKAQVALRLGTLAKKGWVICQSKQDEMIENHKESMEISAKDMHMVFGQKGVDMRIGLDVASLTFKRLVDRIVIISGDTDFIPAMKLARREGVQIVSVQIANYHKLPKSIVHDSDFIRVLTIEKQIST